MSIDSSTPAAGQSVALDSYEKGKLFERFVIELFNEDNFKLVKWRMSEKLEDKLLLNDCANPDLEMIFSKHKTYRFAIECKWRERFIDEKITWASENQIRSYQDLETGVEFLFSLPLV